MTVPDFQSLMLPLLRLADDGNQHSLSEAVERLAGEFQLSTEDRAQVLKSGQTRLYNRVGWSTTYLKKAGLLRAVGPGRFELTERGRETLARKPVTIDVAFLQTHFPEMAAFRRARTRPDTDEASAVFDAASAAWLHRPGVEERIREMLEHFLPDESARHAALRFMAFAIENADEERPDAWYLRETDQGLRLMVARVLACEIAKSKVRVSVIGPVSDDVRLALGSDADNDEEFKFKKIPGGLLLTFPAEHADRALELLTDGVNSFIDIATGRVRTAVSLDDHAPEGLSYIGRVLGCELPQPVPESTPLREAGDSDDDDDAEVSREPRVRGRAPIFEHGQRSIASLMMDIESEVIALPDLQRPFVWEDTKVRDLLDSLFLGFPVGTLVLWHTSNVKDARSLGADRPGLRANILVIDGQQRLTSLYAVMRGVDVIGKNGVTRRMAMAFRPRDGRFEVADAAIRNDPEFLPNVTELWNGSRPKSQVRRDLINALRDKGRVVDDNYEDAVDRNLDRAQDLSNYRFPTVDIRKTAATHDAEVTEEDVAEIFVRINNQGTRLGQADFVLTLLSVFHGKLRDRIEDRALEMSTSPVIAIDAQQLLRAVCGVAFDRARMSAVYRYLRGVDPTTGEADTAERVKRLNQLDDAAKECLEATPWRDYLLRVKHAGFVSGALVASKNAIMNAYVFYVRGRKANVPKRRLDELVSRWVFASLLTARYSGSSETAFEQDLARIGGVPSDDPDGFERALDNAMSEVLTGDYWTHTLVSALETQKARAPAALAFRAAQVVLGTRALFSDQLLQNLLDPPGQGARSASEVHHLFPEAWLRGRGIHDRRRINQVANLADVGWHENSIIGSRGPADYVPQIRRALSIDDESWCRQGAEHALPPGWEVLEYDEFLRERRNRMADVIRVAFRKLGGEASAPPLTPPWFLPGAEAVWQHIATTERRLRAVVREVYTARFGEGASKRIEAALPDKERESLARSLRARPSESEPMTIVDYLYLGQLLPLLFAGDVWEATRSRLSDGPELKKRLQSALGEIAPVRNEIAHVREVEQPRLLRASLACTDVLEMLRSSSTQPAT